MPAHSREHQEQLLSADVRAALKSEGRMDDLRNARRRFLEDGTIAPSVRPVVRAAWKRCRQYGVHPRVQRHQSPDPDRLQRARRRSSRLLEIAKPLLECVHDMLGDARHICYVTDAQGIILRLLADAQTDLESLSEHCLFEGASRREQDVGCTGAGTALAERRPVLLLGPEHFQEAFTAWTCVGIPLRNVDGSIAGALGLSVPNEDVNVYTWGWMLSVAHRIESDLCESGKTDGVDTSLDDLQNPLHAVRGVLELLASEVELSPTHASLLDDALEASEEAHARFQRSLEGARRSQAQLEEANRNRETFLATLAHEMAGPLSALRMCVDLLSKKGSNPEAVTNLQKRMERLTGRLLRLLSDLRDVSAVTQGKLQLESAPLQVPAVIEQAVETVEPLIEERGHQLTVEIDECSLTVEGDADRLVQVISNLLTNAAKYTEPEGRIWLSAQRDEDTVSISVRDTGVGIAPEVKPKIFDPFAQDERNNEGGLGLGLSLVQHLVHMHGGHVDVHSDGPGTGSLFIVELPAAETMDHRS